MSLVLNERQFEILKLVRANPKKTRTELHDLFRANTRLYTKNGLGTVLSRSLIPRKLINEKDGKVRLSKKGVDLLSSKNLIVEELPLSQLPGYKAPKKGSAKKVVAKTKAKTVQHLSAANQDPNALNKLLAAATGGSSTARKIIIRSGDFTVEIHN